jgi:hypothetical protein
VRVTPTDGERTPEGDRYGVPGGWLGWIPGSKVTQGIYVAVSAVMAVITVIELAVGIGEAKLAAKAGIAAIRTLGVKGAVKFFRDDALKKAASLGGILLRRNKDEAAEGAEAVVRHGDFHGPWRPDPGPNGPPGSSWGQYLEDLGAGSIPRGQMRSPHAHHSVMRQGRPSQNPAVEAVQDLFRRRGGIITHFDPDNLAWNSLGGGNHSTRVLADQLQRVRALVAADGTPMQFRELLRAFTAEASARTASLTP